MECNKCRICIENKCNPIGSESPTIYFIGEAITQDELKKNTIFSDRSYEVFNIILDKLGLNKNNCRFNYSIRCYPNNGGGGYRTPELTEIHNCSEYLFEDIVRTDPKVIVLLGNTISKYIIGEEFSKVTNDHGKVYERDINGKKFKFISAYHPLYLYRNRRDVVEKEFTEDIKVAIKLSLGMDISENKTVLKDDLSKTYEIYNYQDFEEFYNKYIKDFDTIAYDIETNAEETHSISHKVVGFSLASSKDVGCYVTLEAIDFIMNSNDKVRIENLLREILTTKKIIVYNCMHELPATLNWLNIEIDDFEDILIMVKLMMGTADNYEGNGGLKAQSVMHLHMKDWSEDLDEYVSAVYKYNSDKDNVGKSLINILSKYYSGNELNVIIRKVKYYAEEVIPNASTFSYGYIPRKLIARYGSIDSSVLFSLKDFYEDWMRRESKNLEIDLFRGYKYWKMHHYAGYILERNGAYWNEDRAKKIEKWCIDGKYETLRNMIRSPLSRKFIENGAQDSYIKYLLENYSDKMIDSDKFTIRRKYSNSFGVVPNNSESEQMLKNMSILPNKQGIYKLAYSNIKYMGRKFIENSKDIYNSWMDNYINEIINKDMTFDEMSKVMNPNSTGPEFRDYVSNMLITPEIRYAKFYDNIAKMIDDPEFILDNYLIENSDYPDDCRVVSMLYKFKISDKDMSSRFDWFKNFINNKPNFKSWKIKRLLNNALDYKFENMNADTFNEIYELYLMCHIDVEDKSTWTPEFDWMFNYKMFKKFGKLLSTYINGKVGRKNVYLVDKDSYSNGDTITRRENLFDGNLPDNKMTMLQTGFKVNIADTGRWTAGIHNLPASDAIKGMFTSRFKGGCIAMPDGSQMEVRTLAAESGDESLLQAFKDGVDIHRFFASRIYSVPYDEVQKWQRGLAKNAVFGMLYGESEKAFADTYLSGDLGKAEEIYQGMFTGFPRIKDYIDRKHNQYETKKIVTTLTQRFIDLSKSRDDPNRILRQSQNYPIQASAEDIAGVILYKLIEWLKDNKMKSKPFCFIHDSIEIDMHPDEVFRIIEKLDYLFNKFPLEEFGVPVACDVPLSMSMGAEIEVADIKCDSDYRNIEIILSGFEDDIEELMENWKETYKSVELDSSFVPSEEDKQVYMPISERFLPKKAPISMKQGSYRNKIERKYKIITK